MNKFKVVVFDFDDTLAVHREWNHEALAPDECRLAGLRNNFSFYDCSVAPAGLYDFVQGVLSEFPSIEMYVLTWMWDSVGLNLKENFVVKNYGEQFAGHCFCCKDPEEKIHVMECIAKVKGAEPSEILLIDDLEDTRNLAREKGFRVLNPIEILTRGLKGARNYPFRD